MSKEKVERALIPYFGTDRPKRAQEEALKHLKKGGKLYYLHITDEASAKSVRYKTGELGEKSELIQNIQEAQKEIQEKVSENYTEEAKMDSAKKGVSIESLYVAGKPAEEILKAIDEYSIQLVVIERWREKIAEVFRGEGIKFLKDKAPCEILTLDQIEK
ncbi:hypothetical protein AKJ36_02675 [candidate division MSBL1 archaeon SCGC-AAA259I07]|uniref:UspA domain-containing protein n=2 Tax=candidate division MSBL1 TaxID=215777 RepID=A0A133U8U5_9EURY|nr:hypothetical protein AKJ61_00280 [candidate division MSBL1 archaeon SCGC-AAA259B11]KXA94552.1 hypothetical protein AKJ36_02675 [candidate division MSBL1 archaeon SCGC-AAA259I07]